MKKRIVRITTVPVSLKYLLAGQLKFINNNKDFEVIAISSCGTELDEVSVIENIDCYSLPMTRKIDPLSDIFSIIKLFVTLRKIKPHIVHTHTPKAGFIGMIAAFFARVPFRFHTVAGMPLMEKSGFLKKILLITERITYKYSNLVLPNSYGLMKYILENKLTDSSKILVLGHGSSNGINLDHYKNSEEIKRKGEVLKKTLGIEDSDMVYLFIGRIVSNKGINELLQAFNEFQHSYKNVKLLLVGKLEPDLDPISENSKNIIQSGNVIHIDQQEDVRPFYSIAHVFVFPSYREGLPNVLLQACAFNVPCIVSDIAGCNEIIFNNINGFLIPAKDYRAIYLAMEKFVTNPVLIRELGGNSREMISKKYEQKFLWGEVLNLYENTLE